MALFESAASVLEIQETTISNKIACKVQNFICLLNTKLEGTTVVTWNS